MKKLLLLAMTASFALAAQAALPFEKGKTVPRRHAHRAAAAPSLAAETQTLLDEDFAKFSDGSESAPGPEITYENSYHIPEAMTAMPGWTGQGVRPAGGCVSLHPWEDSYGDTRGGYISTPKIMLDGTATLTFRAKAAGSDNALLWVALCDDDYGPGDDSFDLEVSAQWQNFTLTASNGSLEMPSYFQFMAEEGIILIDDVKIEFKRDRIGRPYPLHAINNSPTEFVARWEPVNGAEAYLLTVLCTSAPTDIVTGEIFESFDNLNINDDGKTINTDNPGYPEGWLISVSEKGSQDISAEEGNASSAPLSLMFDAVGDMIESPVTPEPIDNLSFWCKPTAYQDDYGSMSLIRLEIYHSSNDHWESIAQLGYFNFPPEGGIYTLDPNALGNDVTRVRFSYIQKGNVDFYIDDIKLHYTTQGITAPLMDDLRVEGTEYTVSDINPANEYNYFVKAVRDDLISSASYTVWVDGITGLKVETREATDVTETSFTAQWLPLGHATSYTVNAFRVLEAKEDMENVTVLEETFDNINEGTIENPGTDWISPFDFGAKGWAATSWCATQPAWAAGMAGTTGTNIWMGTAGLVYTPVLDLSCYDGKGIQVDGTFVTTVDSFKYDNADEPEGIFAIIMDSSDLTQPIASGLLDTPVQGSNTGTILIENVPADADLSKVVIAFMNKSGLSFFVDHAKISMNVPAGRILSTPLTTASTEETSYGFENLDPKFDHAFSVTASTTHNYENYISMASEMRHVKTSSASVTEINNDQSDKITITSEAGILHIDAPAGIYSEIYTTSGIKAGGGIGSYSLPVAPGIYIVRYPGHAIKTAVR